MPVTQNHLEGGVRGLEWEAALGSTEGLARADRNAQKKLVPGLRQGSHFEPASLVGKGNHSWLRL